MKKRKGQIALIVLIISALTLTVGLALSDRVRTSVKIDKDDELLQRAFNAAESGVDSYVSRGITGYVAPDGSTAQIDINDVTGTTVEFGEYTKKDDFAFFWLVGHNSDGTINYGQYYTGTNVSICFNNYQGGFLVYYYGRNGADYGVIRRAYNLNGVTAIENGLATNQSANVCGGYGLGMTFDLGTDFTVPLLLVIKPINGGSKFALRGAVSLPVQGQRISATGTSADVTTSVSVLKRWDPAYYMFFVLDGVVARGTIESN